MVRSVENAAMFITESGDVIHLLGISEPTREAYSRQECTDVLKKLIQGKRVIVSRDSLCEEDEWYVFLDSQLVNVIMLQQGAAAVSRQKHSRSDEFRAAYHTAKADAVGNWSRSQATELIEAVQCEGLTRKHEQCTRMTHDPSRRCWQHKK